MFTDLFLEYETGELESFLQLSMLNVWGDYVTTQAHYVNLFFSHDEFREIYTKNRDLLKIAQKVPDSGEKNA